MNSLPKQRGTAIIVALFVTALVAGSAIIVIDHLRINIRHTELMLNDTHANLHAAGATYWAIDQLISNWKKQRPGQLIDKLPIHSPVNTMSGMQISSVIYDAQGKLNLNNLTDIQFQKIFTRLIRIVAPDVDEALANHITRGVIDWITPGIRNSPFDAYYLKQPSSYQAPHRPMVSVSELRLVKGMNAHLFMRLIAHVTVLPENTPININDATLPLIMSMSSQITFETAKAFGHYRQQNPLINLADLARFPVIQNSALGQNNLTVKSNYFLVKTNIVMSEQHLVLYTLLKRILKNTTPQLLILWQSKGTL